MPLPSHHPALRATLPLKATVIATEPLPAAMDRNDEKFAVGSKSSAPSAHDIASNYLPPELISGGPTELDLGEYGDLKGGITIRITINGAGKPTRVTKLQSTLPRAIEGLIIATFMQSSYRAARLNDRPIESHLDIAVTLNDNPVTQSPSTPPLP